MNKNLRLNNLKIITAMNAKISMFVVYAKAIKYLLLHNLHDSTFKKKIFRIKRYAEKIC